MPFRVVFLKEGVKPPVKVGGMHRGQKLRHPVEAPRRPAADQRAEPETRRKADPSSLAAPDGLLGPR